jgi:hypothetical protein
MMEGTEIGIHSSRGRRVRRLNTRCCAPIRSMMTPLLKCAADSASAEKALAWAPVEEISPRTRRFAKTRSLFTLGTFFIAMLVSLKFPLLGFGLICCALLVYLRLEPLGPGNRPQTSLSGGERDRRKVSRTLDQAAHYRFRPISDSDVKLSKVINGTFLATRSALTGSNRQVPGARAEVQTSLRSHAHRGDGLL